MTATVNKNETPTPTQNRYVGNLAGWTIILANRDCLDSVTHSYMAGELIIARRGIAFYARRPWKLALSYAMRSLRKENREQHRQARDALLDRLEDPARQMLWKHRGPMFDFREWDIAWFLDLAEACRSEELPIPFGNPGFSRYEDWLEVCVGEAVFYSLPELWPDILKDVKDELSFLFDEMSNSSRTYNVTAPPAGYPSPWTQLELETLR